MRHSTAITMLFAALAFAGCNGGGSSALPGVGAPGASYPSTSTSIPDSNAPDSNSPDSGVPPATAPGSAEPGTLAPAATAPETSPPSTTAPRVEFSPAKASDTAVASVHGAGTRAKYIYFTGNYLNASSAGGFGPALLGIYPATARGDVAPLHATTGKNTRLVSPNALWIDPANGALWVCDFNEPFLSMFSAVKWGNVAPRATLHTGFALHACGGIGLSNDGAVVASGFINGAVATWRAGSVGSVAPQRVIRGASTKLIRPTAIAFDRSGDYIVSLQTNPGAIETFDARASGNVTPLRVIAGPQTQLAEIAAMTFDRGSNLIWAASESTNTITAYHAESQGDVKPVVSIHGNNTRLDNPYGIAVDAAGYVYVGNDPQHGRNPHGSILVFAPGANGNATPVQIIKGKKTGLRGVNGLTVY